MLKTEEEQTKEIKALCLPGYIINNSTMVKDIHEKCKSKRKAFVDLNFPHSDFSLYCDGNKPSGERDIVWKRASDFQIKYIFNGERQTDQKINPNDIRQGGLGDCWFLSSLSALAEFSELIEDLFPLESRNMNETGVYSVRICKNAQWQTVLLDDYFPCISDGNTFKSAYTETKDNELWVLLLEKAYSKLCGSYEKIEGGSAYEALIDLTGAPYITYPFDNEKVITMINNGELWKMLKKYDDEKYIICMSSLASKNEKEDQKLEDEFGLMTGHAYTTLKYVETKTGEKLVKFRNPWGRGEWKGDWSDKSSLWTKAIIAEMQEKGEKIEDKDDGNFWMSFKDVLKYYRRADVCFVRRKGDPTKQPWVEARRKFYFEMIGEKIKSPFFRLTVSKNGTFILSIHQEDKRSAEPKPYIDMGLTLLRINKDGSCTAVEKGFTGITLERQHQTEEMMLDPGEYVIVPITTGVKLKKYLETKNKNKNIISYTRYNDLKEKVFSDDVVRTYEEVFNRINLNGDGLLSLTELNKYIKSTGGNEITGEEFKFLLGFEEKDAKGLSLMGYLKAQHYVFTELQAEDKLIKKELSRFGYDESLDYKNGKSAVVVVHADVEYSLITENFDPVIYENADELPVIKFGEVRVKNEFIKSYTYDSGYNGTSIAVKNFGKNPIKVNVNCNDSVNTMSNRGSLDYTEVIKPGEAVLMHHLMPLNYDLGFWQAEYNVNIINH